METKENGSLNGHISEGNGTVENKENWDVSNPKEKRKWQHMFARIIYDQLLPLMVCDNFHGLLNVAEDWVIIVLIIFVSEQLKKFGVFYCLLFYPITATIIGVCMRALSTLLHASSHRCLAKSKLLNDILGTVFSGWCVLQNWTGYHANHIRLHHPYLGDPNKDPDYQAWIMTGLYSPDIKRKDVVRFIMNIPSPKSTAMYVHYLIKDRIFTSSENIYERLARMAFYGLVSTVILKTGSVTAFVVYWLIPLATTANWIGNFGEMMEHYPLLNKSTDPLRLSRNRFMHAVETFVFNPHGETYHLVHHLFPKIPHWNVWKAHEILMQDKDYKARNMGRVGLKAVVDEMLSYFE